MNTNLTEIVFILDQSGSMYSLVNDTIGGFNSFIDAQKKEPGEAVLTTVLFDTNYTILHNGVNIKNVEPLTIYDYCPGGLTAMYDAIGRAIDEVGKRLASTDENERPSKVIFVITTDGLENASTEYSRNRVKEMIQHQTEKYNWQFLFLGANIDAEAAATNIGITVDNAANYVATCDGLDSMYSTLSTSVSSYRSCGAINANWKDGLLTDVADKNTI